MKFNISKYHLHKKIKRKKCKWIDTRHARAMDTQVGIDKVNTKGKGKES